MRKLIVHLCADIGSDSRFYQESDEYEVLRIGVDIGVENFTPNRVVYAANGVEFTHYVELPSMPVI